jgi:hypothetical protein
LQRTQQTGSFLPFEKKTWKSLDELDAGVCDGMTYEEIEVNTLARGIGLCSRYSKSTPKTTKAETRTNSTTDTVEVNLIETLWSDSSPSSWN